jgi:hypothetical protein
MLYKDFLETQEGNKLDFLRNKNNFEKPQRGEINIAWGSAPGNPNYDHVELCHAFLGPCCHLIQIRFQTNHYNDSVCNELCELRLKLNLIKSITYKKIVIDRDFISFNGQKNLIRLSA